MSQQALEINRLLTYVNQLDPLVPANQANLEVWVYALEDTDLKSAQQVVFEYYATVDPYNKQPITPGYIRKQARRIEVRNHRDTVMCAEHDWNPAKQCAECKSEIAAGERHRDQQGQRVKKAIPPPDSIRQQLRQVLAAKDINAIPAPTKEPQ